ncbi:hypothetical protein [Streptacidiphilus jiangxiensis]|uniref:Uncharacterized protein n=1 Tax=Streptacidiphilus jiangxiensis TaxID=235985 RepID=A0A1H8BCM7_STRJI|nr:hypothetical protein [Streptacidiphilus jiangxiensis]SEM80593.1 hypothetical protein SAMN05414137_1622 [Streptacidiphilus jiangxiensis]
MTPPGRSASAAATPARTPEQLLLWPAHPLFPGELLAGESVASYAKEGAHGEGDFELVSVEGYAYRVTRRCGWRIARLPNDWSSSTGGYAWIGLDPTLEQVLAWMRRDSGSRELAVQRWRRWGHLVRDDVPFSTETETEELEPGVLRVSRYGVQGIAADYPWGWEIRQDGQLPESPNRRSADRGRLAYAVWCMTRIGFDRVPTSRLRVVRSYWRQDVDCATGGPTHLGSCKRHHPLFLVEVLDEGSCAASTVVLCSRHLGHRLGGSEGYYPPYRELTAIAERLSGRSFVEWQDRLAELTWDMVAPAVDRGLPVPDVAQALLEEALDAGERRAVLAARRAARQRGLSRREQEAAAEQAGAEQRARRRHLVDEARAEEEAEWERIRRETEEAMSASIA